MALRDCIFGSYLAIADVADLSELIHILAEIPGTSWGVISCNVFT